MNRIRPRLPLPPRICVLLALGSLIGYAVAAVERLTTARASATVATTTSLGESGAPAIKAACCSKESNRQTLLAMAEATPRTADTATAAATATATTTAETGDKPNILVIFGDDIGQTNISAYSFGLMGYETPNIDRIANEGTKFINYYAEQSCTAGRSTFITGQSTLRTGLSKVGVPRATVGLQARDATIAELLKNHGYATGQFGKNHLGDRDEYLPTNHGFDEFFGNLYHLNAEEEPEQRTYPRDPRFLQNFGPRGVIKSFAGGSITDSGPLTRKRMETIDDETSDATVDFITRQARVGKPFFCWFNSTRMHFRTHVRAEHRSPPGLTALTEYADGMIEHDRHVGKLLKVLDDLKLSDNTIVLYTTDNGPHANSWPDAATTPFRSEKDTNWEGAFRAPAMIRWPGKIKAGTVTKGTVSGLDWLPTFLAAAGEPDVKQKLLKGHHASGKDFKSHLDGYNLLPYLTGETKQSPRKEFFYLDDDGELVAMRTKTGSSSSRNNACPAPCASGPSRSRRCGFPRSSICNPIPTSGLISRRIRITTGCSHSPT